jgi:signal peptidase II
LTSVARRAAGLRLTEDPTPVQVGLLLAAAIVVLDQATKELAELLLEPSVFVPLLGDAIGWQLVYNPGGAFGFGAPPWLFIIVTVAVSVIVARTLPHTRSLLQAAAYGLLLAGALGNAVDRVFRTSTTGRDSPIDGEVVDFVAWGSFPRFNVADSAITVGFVFFVVALWREERHAARSSPAADDGPEERGTGAGPDGHEGGVADRAEKRDDGAGRRATREHP